jgi:hypothetical protein
MRRFLSLAALLLAFWPVGAADEPKLNILTAEEIADGWVLLFDGATTFGWKGTGDAAVSAARGALVIGGDKPATLETTTHFATCELAFECLFEEKVAEMPVVAHGVNALLRAQGAKTPLDQWIQCRIKFAGGRAEINTVGGNSASTVMVNVDASLQTSPVQVSVPAGGKVYLRNVKLRPFGVKSIFNGENLTGWKEHPNKKSKFSVEDETIRIKDGPGDLQTEGEWQDFVLQIECKTNGKNLNSGVFFRCRPNEYQQGYEAQIHNGFTAEPSKEYTIETYDPETGRIASSKKEKYAAVDYGTGAIYRRMPARKQAAQDGAWFTMTVVAQGRHLATWVNGLQVVDWTDTRPVKDNARNGCKLDKGPISLQGHDPTTDLNFRHIRIGELPKQPEKK